MEPNAGATDGRARELVRARLLLLLALIVVGVPLIGGLFGWGHDFIQSRWWLSLAVTIWIVCGFILGLGLVAWWSAFRTISSLRTNDPEIAKPTPTEGTRLVTILLLILLCGLWIRNSQAILIPKVLHGFSHPEHDSVAFTILGGSGRLRYDCGTMEIMTEEYGNVDVCRPDELSGRSIKGLTGRLGGSKTIYGFWVENLFLDGEKS